MQASRDCGGKSWYLAAHQPLQSFLTKTLYLAIETDFYFMYKHQVPGHRLPYRADQRCNWSQRCPAELLVLQGHSAQILHVYPAPATKPLRQLQLHYFTKEHVPLGIFLLSQQKHLERSRFSIQRNNMGAVRSENIHITDIDINKQLTSLLEFLHI